MFQDEARFGRMSEPRACWAPAGIRPVVGLALVREFVYAYVALSPADGKLDWMVAEKMNTETMNAFLCHVMKRHSKEFIIMVLDGAPAHRSKDLTVPSNMRLIRLPPYSPELNPTELVWDEIREKEFANVVFDSMPPAIGQLRKGLGRLRRHPAAVRSLTGWDWIISSL
jgi:hypothetical protein